MIDHLVLAVPDLDEAATTFADAGVVLEPGGRHPRHGTHNALVGLGPAQYLEVVAVDPGAAHRSARGERLARVRRAVLFEVVLKAPAHFSSGVVMIDRARRGERLGANGEMVTWELVRATTVRGQRLPDLIRWTSGHPASSLRVQGGIDEVRLAAQDVSDFTAALAELAVVDIEVTQAQPSSARIRFGAQQSIEFTA